MANGKVYALLIGIDYYARVGHLNGCVNDARRFGAYLRRSIPADKLQLMELYSTHEKPFDSEVKMAGATWNLVKQFTGLDKQNLPPTRANMLKYILEHLGQAKKGDTAILFYAGHGSTEAANPYFVENSGTGQLQTLVPCDARMPIDGDANRKVKDVMDKELRVLINRIWKEGGEGPNIVFIQDSCHSEAASRVDSDQIKKSIEKEAQESLAQVEAEEQARIAAQAAFLSEQISQRKPRFCAGDSAPARSFEQAPIAPDVEIQALWGEKGGENFVLTAEGLELRALREAIQAEKQKSQAAEPEAPKGDLAKSGVLHSRGGSPIAPSTGTRDLAGSQKTRPPFHEAFPEGKHIHLSACGRNQYAYETQFIMPETGERAQAGVFTHTLIKTLEATGGKISYRELSQRLRMKIDGIFEQSPGMHAFPLEKSNEFFLSDEVEENQGTDFPLVYRDLGNDLGEWICNVGAIHGLPVLRRNQYLDVEVYSLSRSQERIAAQISYVMPGNAEVVFAADQMPQDKQALYRVSIPAKLFSRDKVVLQVAEPDLQAALAEQIRLDQSEEKFQICNEAEAAALSQNASNSQAALVLSLHRGSQAIYATRFGQTDEALLYAPRKRQTLGDNSLLAEILEQGKKLLKAHNLVYRANPHPEQVGILEQQLTFETNVNNFGSLEAKALQAVNIQHPQVLNALHSGQLPRHEISISDMAHSQYPLAHGFVAFSKSNGLATLQVKATKTDKNLYINTLYIGCNGEVRLLNKVGGELLTPGNSYSSNLMPTKPGEKHPSIKLACTRKSPVFSGQIAAYYKVFVTYRPVDLSDLEQMPFEFSGAEDVAVLNRSLEKSFKRFGQLAGDWTSYLIPLAFAESEEW